MKKMQQIPEVPKRERMTTTFAGYNHHDVIRDGEMYDMKNLTDDQYPVLAERKKRTISDSSIAWKDPDDASDDAKIRGVYGGEKLVYSVGRKLFYNGTRITKVKVANYRQSYKPKATPKKFVMMGSYLCVFPDNIYYNTLDDTDYGFMQRHWSTFYPDQITMNLCKVDGSDYDFNNITVSSTAPANPNNGTLWLDTRQYPEVLREYSTSSLEWVEVPTVYTKITCSLGDLDPNAYYAGAWVDKTYTAGHLGIGYDIKEYDVVNISGLKGANTEPSRVRRQINELNGPHIVYKRATNYIVVEGMLRKSNPVLVDQEVFANREVPVLDYVTVSNNRIWGCRYGKIEDGKTVNEIYACALGDFKNWNKFMGLSTDSYTMSVGTEGAWTGAVTQRGNPVFFKEKAIHKITGQTPSTYQLTTVNSSGVQEGSWRSIAVLNETVFYKTTTDVVMFDGNVPYSIGDNLGDVIYSDARGGVLGNKYYLSMKNPENEWNLFVYDTKRNLWYREDNLHALGFATVGTELYAIDEGDNHVVSITGQDTTYNAEGDVDWMAEFGLSGVEYVGSSRGVARGDMRGYHYLSRFDIRLSLEANKKAELEIEYDSDGHWIKQGEIHGTSMRTVVIPVIPRRCDHLRFRLKGSGKVRVYSISRLMEVGADG